jgi:acyl-CoA synthetase (AMP-forming)/AMP-acid ligase II
VRKSSWIELIQEKDGLDRNTHEGTWIPPTGQEIIQFCKERMVHHKAPKSLDFIESFPRTGSGKVHKKGLRGKYWEGYEKKVH